MGHQYRSSGGKAVVLVVLTFKNQLLPKFDEMYSDWLLLVNLMPSENSSNVHIVSRRWSTQLLRLAQSHYLP